MLIDNVDVWVDEDGKAWKPSEMGSDHLRNTIYYLNKRLGSYAATIHSQNEYMRSKVLKGTPAQFWPVYDKLIEEANRRQLLSGRIKKEPLDISRDVCVCDHTWGAHAVLVGHPCRYEGCKCPKFDHDPSKIGVLP